MNAFIATKPPTRGSFRNNPAEGVLTSLQIALFTPDPP